MHALQLQLRQQVDVEQPHEVPHQCVPVQMRRLHVSLNQIHLNCSNCCLKHYLYMSLKRFQIIDMTSYLFQVRHEVLPLPEAAPAQVRAQAGHGPQQRRQP